MKKIICFILSALMIFSLFSVTATADDDIEVSYSIELEASKPKSGDTYSVGETVTLTVAVSTGDAMGNTDKDVTAPIYAFNGVLNYSSFDFMFIDADVPSCFDGMICKNDASQGRITFSFLCPASGSSLVGVNVESDFVLVQFNLVAARNSLSAASLSDIIITDKNANARPIVSSTVKVDITVGTGESVSDAQTLAKEIENAQKLLDSAVMNPTGELIYPAFTVAQDTYNALSAAIEAAEKALSQATLPDEFLAAEKALISAEYAFEAAKLYGTRPGEGNIIPELPEKQSVEVTASAIGNGKIISGCEKQIVRYGTSVTVMATPDEGYEVEKVVVNGKEYSADEIVTIASVTDKTHIEFYFKETPDEPENPDEPKTPRFTDAAPGSWYFDAVEKIAEMGLFAGTSETEFSPDMPMTRAMLVTVLHRLEGKPAVSAEVTFKDVAKGAWYTDAIAWASTNGIVNGYTADTFGTNDSISRQDMVTILYRYLKYKGLTPAEGAALDAYTDASMVSDYAKPAMQWANATGLVKGTSDTTLSPKDNCTRAQVATIILRYTENIASN